MKQLVLFIGGLVLFTMSTVLLIFIPSEVPMDSDKWTVLIIMVLMGYISSAAYFMVWFDHRKITHPEDF